MALGGGGRRRQPRKLRGGGRAGRRAGRECRSAPARVAARPGEHALEVLHAGDLRHDSALGPGPGLLPDQPPLDGEGHGWALERGAGRAPMAPRALLPRRDGLWRRGPPLLGRPLRGPRRRAARGGAAAAAAGVPLGRPPWPPRGPGGSLAPALGAPAPGRGPARALEGPRPGLRRGRRRPPGLLLAAPAGPGRPHRLGATAAPSSRPRRGGGRRTSPLAPGFEPGDRASGHRFGG
mmetsp:Transcript_99031/g.295842  ORF Transcript_99031/g.295842 Transcript_99031/m.295842 type:complete len:236 (+) Transcript_99031:1849-2556(+)